jgi:hypothetical protein
MGCACKWPATGSAKCKAKARRRIAETAGTRSGDSFVDDPKIDFPSKLEVLKHEERIHA